MDLSLRDTPVKRQMKAIKCRFPYLAKVGTCSSFGLVAAFENALGGEVELSERHLWSQYCIPSSRAAVSAIMKKRGVVEETHWPQRKLKPRSSIKQAQRFKPQRIEPLPDLRDVVSKLDQGHPIYFALSTPKEMMKKLPRISARSKNTGGGHAVAVVGYELDPQDEGGGYLLVKNSWGTSTGNGGYQWLSMGFCRKAKNYCKAWSIE